MRSVPCALRMAVRERTGLLISLVLALFGLCAFMPTAATAVTDTDRASAVTWSGGFDLASSPCAFDRAGWDPYLGGGDFPYCGSSVRISNPASEGVPTAPTGDRAVGRFEVSVADAQAQPPRYHAKVMKAFYAPGYDDGQQDLHHTRPPNDVSGTYRAWYYVPPNYTIPGTGWRNIFQFKERYWDGTQSGYQSVPTWWLDLGNAWWLGDGNGTLLASVNYWNGGDARNVGEDVPVPRGRWFEVTAVIRQNVSIEWRIDGRLIGIGLHETWPVSPSHGSLSLAWNFGVGNYSGAGESGYWANRVSGAPLYVSGARYSRD